MRTLVLAAAIALALPYAGQADSRRPMSADAALAQGQKGSYIVSFIEPAAPLFTGFTTKDSGRPKLAAVAISVTGRLKYDPQRPEAQAYLDYIGDLREQRLDAASAALGRELAPKFVYEHALNGVALDLTPAEAEQLAAMPGIRAVTPDFERFTQTERGPLWIKADTVWNGTAGVTSRGEGVVVGVIDSGINSTHPSFAATASGFTHTNPRPGFLGFCVANANACTTKLIGVYDFVSGGTNGTASNAGDPDGHGTHVASTAVGNPVDTTFSGTPLTITGVAPRSNLIAYRGCGSTPGSRSCGANSGSILIASINQAIADSVDVINYSIGGEAYDPWLTVGGSVNSDHEAFLAAREAGIVVVAAAGNDGPNPGTHGSPSNAPWVVAVAAVTHDRTGAGDRLASFSGRGPVVPLGVIKPDVAAPGVSIRAADNDTNGVAVLSGTSMASPHVAGAAALISAARPSWTADEVVSALTLTARADNIVPETGSAVMTPHDRGAGTVDLSLAVNASLALKLSAGQFRNSSTSNARLLNLPSLGHDNCVETCTLTRTFSAMQGTSGGTYQVIANLPNTIAMTPVSNFTLANGAASQAVNFTFATTAQTSLNNWAYGSVTIRRVGGGTPDLKLPVAIYLSSGAEPALVAVNVTGERGFVDIPVSNVISLPNARFGSSDLANALVKQAGLIQDPTRSDPYDDLATGVTAQNVTLDYSDGRSRTFRVSATLGPVGTPAAQDLDLFVGVDTSFDQSAQEVEERCSSTSAGNTESCVITVTHPGSGPAITVWALAQNFQSSTTGATDQARLELVAIDPTSSTVQKATGPGATTTNQSFNARLVYDDPTFLNGQSRYGFLLVDRGPGQAAVRVPYKLTRTDATPAPFALANATNRVLTLPGNGAQDRLYIDVPAGATQLTATTTSSDAVDLYLARIAYPAASSDVPSIAAAPARNLANASATTGSGNESVTVANPAAGRWYITPVNTVGTAAAVTVRATVTGTAPIVRPGGYFNTQRSGHGLFVYPAGADWAGLWYTYLQDGTPTWYYLQGAAPAANGLWSAQLFRSAWNGTANNLVQVGSATIAPTAGDQFVFSYNLDGQTGSEPFVNFGRGCPSLSGSPLNVSSHWFNPARSGTGYSVQMIGGYEFYAAFVYDGAGVARFLVGENPTFGGASATLSLEQLNGFCPLCTRTANPSRTSIGTWSRTFSGGTISNFTLNGTYVNGAPGTWTGNESVQLLGGPTSLQGCVTP
jgi:subtilisin family serine protease